MLRWIIRLAFAALLLLLAGLLATGIGESRKVVASFNDRLLDIAPDAAIQAGYVQTMHEQRWASHAFVHIMGLTLPRGKTEAVIRAPIKVYYGVRPRHIHAEAFAGGVLQVAIDKVEVLNVATDLAHLEIETDVGWARLDSVSGEEARRAARKAFDRTRFHAADKLLAGADVTEHVRRAIEKLAASLGEVREVRILRRDLPPDASR